MFNPVFNLSYPPGQDKFNLQHAPSVDYKPYEQ